MHATSKPSNVDINSLLDINAVRNVFDDDTAQLVPVLKQAVSNINDGLKQYYMDGIDVEDIVYGRAELVDQLLLAKRHIVFYRLGAGNRAQDFRQLQRGGLEVFGRPPGQSDLQTAPRMTALAHYRSEIFQPRG